MVAKILMTIIAVAGIVYLALFIMAGGFALWETPSTFFSTLFASDVAISAQLFGLVLVLFSFYAIINCILMWIGEDRELAFNIVGAAYGLLALVAPHLIYAYVTHTYNFWFSLLIGVLVSAGCGFAMSDISDDAWCPTGYEEWDAFIRYIVFLILAAVVSVVLGLIITLFVQSFWAGIIAVFVVCLIASPFVASEDAREIIIVTVSKITRIR